MQGQHLANRWHHYAVNTHAAVNMVLGWLPGDDPDSGVGAVEVRLRKDAEQRAAKYRQKHEGGIPPRTRVQFRSGTCRADDSSDLRIPLLGGVGSPRLVKHS